MSTASSCAFPFNFALNDTNAPHHSKNAPSHLDQKCPQPDTCTNNSDKENEMDVFKDWGLCGDLNRTLLSLAKPLSFFKQYDYKANKRLKPSYLKQIIKVEKPANYCSRMMYQNLSIVAKTVTEDKQIHRQMRLNDQNHSSRCIVKASEMNTFFYLTEDPTIQKFLKMDGCRLIADKLRTMVIPATAIWCLELGISSDSLYQIYLANDMEEDEEELKYEIFPWALGISWKEKYKHFLKLRDMLFRRMDYKAIVSRRCCEEIMAIEPEHELWKRCRPPHHSGAIRFYERDSSYGIICGPLKPPHLCQECNLTESADDAVSGLSPELTTIKIQGKKKDCDFPGPDDIWRTLEE